MKRGSSVTLAEFQRDIDTGQFRKLKLHTRDLLTSPDTPDQDDIRVVLECRTITASGRVIYDGAEGAAAGAEFARAPAPGRLATLAEEGGGSAGGGGAARAATGERRGGVCAGVAEEVVGGGNGGPAAATALSNSEAFTSAAPATATATATTTATALASPPPPPPLSLFSRVRHIAADIASNLLGIGADDEGEADQFSSTKSVMVTRRAVNEAFAIDDAMVAPGDWRGPLAVARDNPAFGVAARIVQAAGGMMQATHSEVDVADDKWLPRGEALSVLLGTSNGKQQADMIALLAADCKRVIAAQPSLVRPAAPCKVFGE